MKINLKLPLTLQPKLVNKTNGFLKVDKQERLKGCLFFRLSKKKVGGVGGCGREEKRRLFP